MLRWKCIDPCGGGVTASRLIGFFRNRKKLTSAKWQNQKRDRAVQRDTRFQTFGSGGKHASEKVTLTARVSAALCKNASQLSGDTRWQSGREERGCEHCHHISVLVAALLKTEAWRKGGRKCFEGRLINKQGVFMGWNGSSHCLVTHLTSNSIACF